jgi:hypothetical protein
MANEEISKLRGRRHDRAAAALISAYVRELVVADDTSSALASETSGVEAIANPVAGAVSGDLPTQV